MSAVQYVESNPVKARLANSPKPRIGVVAGTHASRLLGLAKLKCDQGAPADSGIQ
jgi:hypothetical protein